MRLRRISEKKKKTHSMYSSPCLREASQAFPGCCPNPLLGFPDETQNLTSSTSAAASRYEFEVSMASSLYPYSLFTNHESVPSLPETFSNFTKAFPQYSETDQADRIRENEYFHLSLNNHVCLDYIGHGLFSYSQQQSHGDQVDPHTIATTSSAAPSLHPTDFRPPFFDISYKSVDLISQMQHGGEESEVECMIRRRIMAYMNTSEDDYSLVFTANQSSAFKLLADSYPFQSNRNLLTVYDYENEAVKLMIESSKKKGARPMTAEFSWPSLRIRSGKLRKKIASKKKKRERGLFVFPLQSKMTGARYSYLWMSLAQENGWHVLLDTCALGPKEMETLGLSLFKPDFLICSFFKVFGDNPSGFGCLFVKKSRASVLKDSSAASSIGMMRLVPASKPSQPSEDSSFADTEAELNAKFEFLNAETGPSSSSGPISSQQVTDGTFKDHENEEASEIELVSPSESKQPEMIENSITRKKELECKGLDHADSLGLVLISIRSRYLINWLVNALMSLQHPSSESGIPPVRIYGPKIKFERGAAVAFNVFDWKGEKIDPALVQKLADRNNVSLSYGFLQNIWFSDKYEEERERILETRTSEQGGRVAVALSDKRDKLHSGISVVTAALGLLTNFEDMYRLWTFVSRFLDADFVEKERWRYKALNQKTVEV